MHGSLFLQQRSWSQQMKHSDRATSWISTQQLVSFGDTLAHRPGEGLVQLSNVITAADCGDLSLALNQALTLPTSPHCHSLTASH